jgi:putative ATPase
VFEVVSLARHHLVLDLNTASGLLAWEALRQTPEGGVWAHTTDPKEASALRQSASRLPELERLGVLCGPIREVPRLLADSGEPGLRFDAVLGRALFTPPVGELLTDGWSSILGMIRSLLLQGGRACLLQAVPRLGQRLSSLVDWSGEDPALAQAVREAEEALYGDPAVPRLSWDAADLEAALHAAGFAEVTVSLERSREERRLAGALLDRWFGAPDHVGAGVEPSYAARLGASGLDADRLARVEARFRRQLTDQVVPWEGVTALLSAKSE